MFEISEPCYELKYNLFLLIQKLSKKVQKNSKPVYQRQIYSPCSFSVKWIDFLKEYRKWLSTQNSVRWSAKLSQPIYRKSMENSSENLWTHHLQKGLLIEFCRCNFMRNWNKHHLALLILNLGAILVVSKNTWNSFYSLTIFYSAWFSLIDTSVRNCLTVSVKWHVCNVLLLHNIWKPRGKNSVRTRHQLRCADMTSREADPAEGRTNKLQTYKGMYGD